MARELRRPLDAADFNALGLEARIQPLDAGWWHLRWAHHDTPGKLFFASASGRLTPESGEVACLYLAKTRETSFHEIYGDIVDAARKRKQGLIIARGDLERRVYLKNTETPTVKLYDLTKVKSAKAIGLDLATLYSPEITHPRLFAQRLHGHPEKFDGIRYQSRHTQTPCVVLWATHNPKLKGIILERQECLWDLVQVNRKHAPASLELFGATLEVAAALA